MVDLASTGQIHKAKAPHSSDGKIWKVLQIQTEQE